MTVLKPHIALNVTDIAKSVAFYRAMFGVEPVKHKADYAKFDLENPALNFTLNLSETLPAKGALSHLGIQVSSSADVVAAGRRFAEAGLQPFAEENTNCCYALQDKVWIKDPDGNAWEIFVVKVADTAPEQNICATPKKEPCCASRTAVTQCCS